MSARIAPILKRSPLSRPTPILSSQRDLGTTLKPQQYADREVMSISQESMNKRPLALVIAAYNESLVLEHTIQSAIDAGLSENDIYVVDDCSSDGTARIARKVLHRVNVLSVGRSGKGLAIHTVVQDLRLTDRYDWIHIADADGEFDSQYFVELYENLDPSYAAATGYVASLPGSYISQYRAFEYTMGMDVTRRFQSLADVITIVPGPTSVFRSDVFEKLDFNANALCEDFDVTLQIHRKGLGKIQFIPSAVARTQDPGTFKDFTKQITRWNRGVMQMFFKHRIGLKASRVDAYLIYQMLQNISFFTINCVLVPLLTIWTGSIAFLALAFLSDVIVVLGFVVFAQLRTGRKDIVSAFPLIYALRWVSLAVFVKCFVEVFILQRFHLASGVWETAERRAHA